MDGNDAMASALLTAFNALIEVATPDQVVPVLRRAVTALLAEEPTPARSSETTPKPSKRNRTRWVGNIEAWRPVRDKVLARLAERNMTRRELCDVVGIAYPTLRCSLLPSGRAPGKANIVRLQHWLGSMEVREDGAADNGHAQEAAVLPAYKLTTAERERLAAWRELEEERTLRAEVGLATDVIDKAVAGQPLAPEIVSRLVDFLQQQQPAIPGA